MLINDDRACAKQVNAMLNQKKDPPTYSNRQVEVVEGYLFGHYDSRGGATFVRADTLIEACTKYNEAFGLGPDGMPIPVNWNEIQEAEGWDDDELKHHQWIYAKAEIEMEAKYGPPTPSDVAGQDLEGKATLIVCDREIGSDVELDADYGGPYKLGKVEVPIHWSESFYVAWVDDSYSPNRDERDETNHITHAPTITVEKSERRVMGWDPGEDAFGLTLQ